MTSSSVIDKMSKMLKDLLVKQKQHLDHFFAHFDVAGCEKLVQEIASCQGVLFFTGVGKSGFIAQKIAATMQSTGTKAFFLQPIDALHGDLGMVSKKDLVVILSKSGETEELLQLLPFIRNKGAQIIAVSSNRSSRLARAADRTILLPCEQELCPFDLAPTTSTVGQLLFGDLLAIVLMELHGFGLEQYAENHPGGRIGRRATMRVRDLMLNKERTPICFAEDCLEEVLIDFTDKRCGCMIVIDKKRQLKGIFTDGDLRRALQAKKESVLKEKVGELMTCSPKAIAVEALAWDALQLMESDQKHPVMVLPVLDDQKEVVGIIKMHDLIQAGL
jgi:arabinose-5-phosphate isomerase